MTTMIRSLLALVLTVLLPFAAFASTVAPTSVEIFGEQFVRKDTRYIATVDIPSSGVPERITVTTRPLPVRSTFDMLAREVGFDSPYGFLDTTALLLPGETGIISGGSFTDVNGVTSPTEFQVEIFLLASDVDALGTLDRQMLLDRPIGVELGWLDAAGMPIALTPDYVSQLPTVGNMDDGNGPSPVPLPPAAWFLLSGLAGLGYVARHRSRAAA